jgi:type VI secretion system secreted protein VgrG
MANFTQDNRPMRVDTVLGEDVLLLAGFHGLESVSEPFEFQLDLISEDEAVDAEQLVRSPALVTVQLPDGEERQIHGHISRFFQLSQQDGLTFYRAELVPWLWFLNLSQDCRIFQNLSVPEIVEEVFTSLGFSDFKLKCTRNYPKRDYCVQYRETHFNFVSRLLEEEGIFYFFEHSDSQHVLVLTDNNGAIQPCPGVSAARLASVAEPDEDVVTEIYQEHAAYVGKITLKDYDFLQPSLKLESSISGDGKEEVYDYHPGRFTTIEEGERYARLQLEAAEAVRQTVRGSSTCRSFQAGCSFELTDHYRSDMNREYALLRVQHFAAAGDYRSWNSAPFDFQNQFVAIPADVPFRPGLKTHRPVVHGSQTAVVVGPPGEEVYVDKYGRVKVQFYWDRNGKKNDNSSCWVRVATPWGGKGYGGITIPRIGNEVVVDFLEGDPDRPLIVGSVYNADQTAPFGLPGAGIQMGMKSRSSPGGGGYNEITLTDTKGTEQITIHAQYDMSTVVEHDQTTTVHNDQTNTIDNDRTEQVGANESIAIGGNRREQVGGDESVAIGGNRNEQVGSSESINIGSNRSRTVGINDAITVGAAQQISVGGAQAVSVGGMQAITVGVNQTTNVGGNQSTSAGGNQSNSVGGNQSNQIGRGRSSQVAQDDSLKVGKKLVIDAGDEITIKTGKASIMMKKDGTVQISGKDITIKGTGKINVKASKDVTVKGQKILQN